MSDDDHPTKMEIQHTEIDEAEQNLRQQRMFLERFMGMRGAEVSGPTKSYLKGVHDGLCWGGREIQSITQYEDWQRTYDPRFIPDEGLSAKLKTIVSEAHNGNYGNVRVNAERLVEYCEEAAEDDADDCRDGGSYRRDGP